MNNRPSTSLPSAFEVIPAIDLRGGRVVRLRQGDFAAETAYADDPVAVARRWATAGARRLHLVDLDGARLGRPAQLAAVGAIVLAVGEGVRCQVGGGLRDAAAVAAALATGADRAIIGTAALTTPDLLEAVVERHGVEAIAVALDVRDGRALGDGWGKGSAALPVGAVLAGAEARGVRRFVVTAIARDGLLGGPDLGLLAGVRAGTGAALIASGGITRGEDLDAVAVLGYEAVIVGRALYEGTLDPAVLGRPA